MNGHDLSKVKDRIRKLLNLSRDDGAAEGEISNALRFAKEMMDNYHLSEEDLAEEPADLYDEVDRATKSRQFVSVGKRFSAWENCLADFVSRFVGGLRYYLDYSQAPARDHRGFCMMDPASEEPYRGVRFAFYGIAEDVAIAAEMFHELRTTIIAMARLKFGGCYRSDGAAYAQGFVHGLHTKLKDQESEKREKLALSNSSTALVLVERRGELIQYKSQTAEKWLKGTLGIKLGRGTGFAGTSTWDKAHAYGEGVTDGKSSDASVNRTKRLGVTQ